MSHGQSVGISVYFGIADGNESVVRNIPLGVILSLEADLAGGETRADVCNVKAIPGLASTRALRVCGIHDTRFCRVAFHPSDWCLVYASKGSRKL